MHRQHDDPTLARVRKLLAKAEDDATTSAEAELYTAKATELIAAYGIDQALLAAEQPRTGSVTDRRVHVEAPYARDKAQLLGTVAMALRCHCVQSTHRGERGTGFALHLFGHACDLERAEILFTSLLLQSAAAMRTTPVPRREHPAAFRRSWLAGFTAAVGHRLREAEERAAGAAEERRTASSTSAAVVLRDRDRAVERVLHEAYPRLRSARARRLSGSGAGAGHLAGQHADLGGTRIGLSEPAALD